MSTSIRPLQYTVESQNKQTNGEQYSCDIIVTRHVKPEEPFNPNAHFFKGNSLEKLFANSINKVDVIEKNGVQYAAVADGNILGLYKLDENEAQELILQDAPNTVNTGEEIISTVTHYTYNNQVYVAVGVKSNNEDKNARLLVYSIDNDGKLVGNSNGGPLIAIDLGKKAKVSSIVPIVENTGVGYFAVALQGNKEYGYIQKILFYRFDVMNNTYVGITNNENKILGLNTQKLAYYSDKDGRKYLLVVNKNNPAEYKVNSELVRFVIEDSTIKVIHSIPIATSGAENAIFFTNNDTLYAAFAEGYSADKTQKTISQIFSIEDSGNTVSKKVDLAENNPPYQVLIYSLLDANMQPYDYLMYVTPQGSSLYQWDPAAQTTIPYGGSPPGSNGATTDWEFVKKGENDYYLLAVKNQENAGSGNTNKVIETYQVTDR